MKLTLFTFSCLSFSIFVIYIFILIHEYHDLVADAVGRRHEKK